MGVDQCYRVRDREEFQLVGVPVKPGGSSILVKADNGSLASTEVEADIKKSDTSFMKRKRGRPPKGQTRSTRSVSKKKEEEDVCFICFDGGSLVLCDRRGCPKAYHPSCIKRDAAFFRSRAKWTCGWHICSKCQKAAHYMCYTCTYSLCKGCTKGADYVSVRGNFGFCGTCMRTIMLIENSPLGNKEKCEVDFDDKTSWEYLFKVYWVYLKSKLSLTLDELNRGQSPWKGDLIMGSTGETCSTLNHERHEKCSVQGSSCLDIETNDCKRRKTIDHSKSTNKEDSTCFEELGIDKKIPLPESGNWESDELLETNNLKTRKSIDHQNSVSKEARYVEKFGVGKKMPLPQSTNWEKKELLKTKDPKRRKTMGHRNSVREGSTYIEKLGIDEKMHLPESTNWASKELLEFVGHVKNGDTSVLSQYGVQALLLEYIEKNNLSDPCQKCEVLCDANLKNLFGRARVSQIEVPKLLKSHFLVEEYSPGEINLNMRSLDSSDHGETNGLSDSRLVLDIDKRHGPRKVIGIQVSPNDLNAFEAIDSHIMKLIYLRRKQMEILVEDADTFHQKVVGSIVRIKIPNGDRKADKYRLVLVVGTREVAQQYRVGIRTADVMLEIVNVNKKEVISIDGISNQEFSEDECRRFRRSIKTGLSKFLNVCDIQEKEMILRAIRVDNLQGTETLQLNHLHDRPSEKGYNNEPRESAKKLSNSEDEQQQSHEIPAVQSDHKMDRSYGFDDHDAEELKEKMTGDNFRSNSSGLNREERKYLSPKSRDYDLNDIGTGVNETSAASYDQAGRKSSLETEMIIAAQGTNSSAWGSKCTFDSTSKTLQMNEEVDFFELPSLDPMPNNVLNSHACQNKESPSSWSTASSLVSEVSYPEAVACREYSPMPTQLSVEEWDSSFVRPKKIAIDHVVTPSSISSQHPQSSPSKPAYNESNWQVIINDSNDFSFDESVSDLLAEVEAMESRGGVDSPTSIVNYGEEFTDASKNDCLSSAEKLIPLPDPGKGDAMSSTADAQLTMYSTSTKEQHVGNPADILQCQRMTGAQSGVGARKNDSFVQQKEASANMPVSVPSTTTWEVTAMDMPWRLGSDFASTMWGTAQGNVNLGWGSLANGNSNMTLGFVQGSMQESGGRISSCTTTGNPGIWGSQTRSTSDRISSSKDQNLHGRDYGCDWGRTNGNRQPISDMVNETASQRHAPKGQATCKYYERGFCNKGGSCSHWHP